MNRLLVRRPAMLRRRSVRARRLAVAHDAPLEYSAPGRAPRWLTIGAGVLGLAAIAELIVALAVLS